MKTERLIIDKIKPSDRNAYFLNISHDKKVLETFICNYCGTVDELDISRYVGRDDMFAIRLGDTGEFIGLILYFDVKDETCEIGYGIGSKYWGRGYATEAVRRFIEYLFDSGFGCVRASFFEGNDASRRVMEKCGMRFSHVAEKELTYLGVERDLLYYEIKKEWKNE